MNAKILKSEKELKALDNTHQHLKNRNSNYRDSYLQKVSDLFRELEKRTSIIRMLWRISAKFRAKIFSRSNRSLLTSKKSLMKI